MLVSCSSGLGHVRAAEALFLHAKTKDPNWQIEHIDLAKFSSPFISFPATTGYTFLVRHLPRVFKILYDFSDSPFRAASLEKLAPLARLCAPRLLKHISDFAPERIICTHFLAAPLLKKFQKNIPIDMVITDYSANKIWFSPFVRRYFVGHEHTRQGAPEAAAEMIISGLPLHQKFLKEKNTEEIKNKLNIPTGRPTILLLAGGDGLIDSSHIASQILSGANNLNLIAIAGKKNQKIYEKLNRLQPGANHFQVIKFTEDIDELMRIADIVISKPGGLTVNECLHLGKPLLMINPIPGQEEANAEFIEKYNYGVRLRPGEKVTDWINKILGQKNLFQIPPRPDITSNDIILAD